MMGELKKRMAKAREEEDWEQYYKTPNKWFPSSWLIKLFEEMWRDLLKNATRLNENLITIDLKKLEKWAGKNE